ncbi:MAG: hypothetical protein ACR5LA_12705 [Wolbachia sp.]
MNIRKLQEELVEKISLILIENDEANVERALEIINQLGEDHINDTTIMDRNLTVLDCVIICDSRGNNPRISPRPRLNNRELKKLEDAIRNIGGRTAEELGLVQDISYDRDEFQRFFSAIQAFMRRAPEIVALAQASGERIRILERVSERASGQELQALERRIQNLQTLSEASEQGLRTLGEVLERELIFVLGRREMETLLQTTEKNIQALKQALEEDLQISRDLSIQAMKKEVCTLFTLAFSVSSLYLAYQSIGNQGFSLSRLAAIGTGAAAVFGLRGLLRESTQERPISGSLENVVAAQHNVEERQLTQG